jgi:hypothetical protein
VRILTGFVLAALLLVPATPISAAPAAPAASEAALVARAYQVQHRSLSDAADVVTRVLSPEGTLKLQPRLKTIVVEDHPSVLQRVDQALLEFDLPPRNVEVTLTLLLGSDVREPRVPVAGAGPREISREVRGVSETLGDFTKWTNYELLGSQSLTASEGRSVTARLSEEYRVTVVIESVEAPSSKTPSGMVSFGSLVLQRITHDDSGAERADEVYSTAIQLHMGKLLMVGAARSPESRRALFLAIKAKLV